MYVESMRTWSHSVRPYEVRRFPISPWIGHFPSFSVRLPDSRVEHSIVSSKDRSVVCSNPAPNLAAYNRRNQPSMCVVCCVLLLLYLLHFRASCACVSCVSLCRGGTEQGDFSEINQIFRRFVRRNFSEICKMPPTPTLSIALCRTPPLASRLLEPPPRPQPARTYWYSSYMVEPTTYNTGISDARVCWVGCFNDKKANLSQLYRLTRSVLRRRTILSRGR